MSFQDDIDDLLYCAFKYDEKPHMLFSCIRRIAEDHELDKKTRDEIIRLMDEAYN